MGSVRTHPSLEPAPCRKSHREITRPPSTHHQPLRAEPCAVATLTLLIAPGTVTQDCIIDFCEHLAQVLSLRLPFRSRFHLGFFFFFVVSAAESFLKIYGCCKKYQNFLLWNALRKRNNVFATDVTPHLSKLSPRSCVPVSSLLPV